VFHPFLQPLEPRRLLSVSWQPNRIQWHDASASLRSGVLSVHGTSAKDDITFSVSTDRVPFLFPVPPGNTRLVVHVNDNAAAFSFNDIKLIKIAGGGDDFISVLSLQLAPFCYNGQWIIRSPSARSAGATFLRSSSAARVMT